VRDLVSGAGTVLDSLPAMACSRYGPASSAASARILRPHPARLAPLRSQQPIEKRGCRRRDTRIRENGRNRPFTSRSASDYSPKNSSTDVSDINHPIRADRADGVSSLQL
jgi:hypothetical protein